MTPRSATRGLLIATTAAGGLMGSLLDRIVVATPAWRHLGAQAWAAYSRHADLGNGQILYPVSYIGLTILAVAAVTVRADRTAPPAAAAPVYLQALFIITVLALTIKAAPILDSTARLSQTSALRQAFSQFTFWGVYLRGATVILAFLSSVWALTAIARAPAGVSTPQRRPAGERQHAQPARSRPRRLSGGGPAGNPPGSGLAARRFPAGPDNSSAYRSTLPVSRRPSQ
jgi:hypothetical protein